MPNGSVRKFSRRHLIRASLVLAAGATPLLAACGTKKQASPTAQSQAPGASTPGASPAGTQASAPQPSGLKQVPRNRTLMLRWGGQAGRYIDAELWNPYAVGANHQNGPSIFYEPLAYYSAFADKTYPWLAESWEYSTDYKQLKITTRSGINWSDGTPFTAEDVAFTLNSLRDLGSKVRWGVNVQQFVEEAKADDDPHVTVTFKVPAPRFMFFMTYKYDIGVYPVPKHIFEGQDWASFKAFDIANGLPVTTGPWKLVFSSPDQKVIDRRDDWWAVKAGLVQEMPKVERIIYLPFADETQVAQQLIQNEIDTSLDLRPLTIERIIKENPKVITHTGHDKPYGYMDWWPTSLYVNNTVEPYNDRNVRWALSYFIDRQQVIDVALGGASTVSPLPMPAYPGLQPYFDAVKDLLQKYPTNEFNPDKGAELLTQSGFTKNGSGIWEKDGKPLKFDLLGFEVMADIGPVIAEQLRRQGIDTQYAMPPDMVDQFQQGNYTAALFGHGGSIGVDPYDTLTLYQSRSEAVPGGHQVNFSKWSNAEYDKIVDEMAVTPPEQKDKIIDEWVRAMEIWLPELPDIQIQEWYHRMPMNTTYWEGWPTNQDSYVNGAFWHLTFQLTLNRLQPTQ